MKKEKLLKYAKYFGWILLGNLLYSFAIEAIVVPNGIVTGGITGVSLYIEKLTGIKNFNLILLWIFTVIILAIGYIVLGKEVALQSVTSALIYPVCRTLCLALNVATWLQFNDPWIQIITAGLLIGVGLGFIIKVNASTGGMDTIALVFHKYCKLLTVGAYLVVLDVGVMTIQIPTAGLENFIFGIAMALVYTYAIDKVVMTGKSKVELLIVSNKQEEVRNLITYEYDRTVTFLHSRTGYLNHEIDTILTIVDLRELNKLKDHIYQLDPGAFIIVNKVSEVSGRGFTVNKKYKNNNNVS